MPTIDEVRAAVRSGIQEANNQIGRGGQIVIGDVETFSDFGLDSLDQMNLLLELEKAFKVNFDGVEMDSVNTITKIHAFLNAAPGA
jgi:acyl carrier protein